MILNNKSGIIRHLCSTPRGPLPFDSEGLNSFLPQTRSQAGLGSSSGITYDSYLRAVEAFLDKHQGHFWQAVSRRLGVDGRNAWEINVITEKHGSDYHPSRVTVRSGDVACSFVVNVALSQRGKENLSRDVRHLHRLNKMAQPSFVPEVYFKDEQIVLSCDGTNIISGMFLGEWFEDFHEFHLTADHGKDSFGLVLWDFDRGYLGLSENQAYSIYRQVASILTWYYNPETCEEIFPWHHASGDFVAKVDMDAVDVRLITVRQYASRVGANEISELDRLNYLLFFLVNLTIRMRLDRLDGIGDIAWADSRNIKPCVDGFLDAIQRKAMHGYCDRGLISSFVSAVRDLSPGDLANIFQLVVESYNEDAPDIPVITSNLPDHILQTYLALRETPDLV